MAAPHAVLRGQLLALLWSTRAGAQARGSLRQALHELQEALEPLGTPVLAIDRLQVMLRTTGIEIDVRRPDDLAAAASHDRVQVRFLDDLGGIDPAFDAWLMAERRALSGRVRAVVEDALNTATDPTAAIQAAERLLTIDRAHEGAWQAIIRARLDQGNRSAAIAGFEECCLALAEAAHLTPSTATKALVEEARTHDGPLISPQPGFRPARPNLCGPERNNRMRVGVAQFRPLPGSIATDLAASLGEEIIAALARFRGIACVPIASIMPLLPNLASADAIWPQLGLDFLLDGTVQQNGEQVRVIVRVLDLRTVGEVVWSGRFDRAITTVFDLQDDIASAAVAQLEPRLLLWEGERLTAVRRVNPTAAELLRMAIPSLFRLDRSSFQIAGERLERALALDPDNPGVHSWLAQWHLFAIGQGWAADVPAATHRARELASRAIDLDPGDARALTLAGHVRGFIERLPDEALELHDRAIEVNPNLPLAWCRSAFAHSYAGRHQEALRRAAQARHLSPEDPLAFLYEGTLAVPHLLLGQYEEAVRRGSRAIALNPSFSSSYKTQLAALGHLGRREQADEIRARLLALEPGFSVSQAMERSPIRPAEDRERYAEGLRRGGLP